MANEQSGVRDMGSEFLFVEALKSIQENEQRGWLGDKYVVESILRNALFQVLDGLPQLAEKGMKVSDFAYRVGAREMRVFLRENSQGHKGVRGWNVPGGVDVFAAKWVGVDADRPIERLIGVFLEMVSEALEIENQAQNGESAEQWMWQVDELLERYAFILIGISPADQVVLL